MQTAGTPAKRARTKIVATVGPACRDERQLAALADAGVDVFRLNMAHGRIEEHEGALHSIRRLSRERRQPIAVLVDLAGPKIRLGELAGGELACREGAEVRLVRGEVARGPGELVANYDRLVDELDEGDRLLLADGTVSLEVLERASDFARCRVTQPGTVRNRQGVNLPGARLSLPAISDADRRHAVWAAEQAADFVGLSFVRAPDEVLELRDLLRSHNSAARVVAKIEKQEALDRLEEIVAASGGVMVARGDLGVEIDVARMPVAQKQIVAACHEHQKPVIIATQMLDSMQRSRYPTRAEVTDVANAILDGCDACMLSGETAVGDHPREAVEMMNRIALATEPLFRSRLSPAPARRGPQPPELQSVTQAVVLGAGRIAQELDARLVVVATHSGATALALANQRNFVPTVGVSDREATLRQMCLYWGVIPLAGAPATNIRELVDFIEAWGLGDGCLAPGDRVVLAAGTGPDFESHNMLMVHEVRSR